MQNRFKFKNVGEIRIELYHTFVRTYNVGVFLVTVAVAESKDLFSNELQQVLFFPASPFPLLSAN